MTRKRILCIICIWFTTAVQAKDNYTSVEEGLSNRYVSCVLQDHRGLIWVGTTNGLNLYDGYTFKSYFTWSKDLTLSNSRINAIVEDAAGNLWVATDRGLNKITADRSLNQVPDALKNKNISSLLLQKDYLLLGTAEGEIIRTELKTLAMATVFKESHDAAILHLQQDATGNILFITSGEKTIRKLLPSFRPAPQFNFHEPIQGNFVVTDSFLISSSKGTHGLFAIDRHGMRVNARLPEIASQKSGIPVIVYAGRDGSTWFACAGGIVTRINLTTGVMNDYSHLFNHTNFGSDIKCFYEDKNGMMWVGTDGGLVKVPTSSLPFKSYLSYDPAHANTSISTRGMTEDKAGNIFIGTYNGLYELAPDGTLSRHLLADGTIPAAFRMLMYDDHTVLMTTVTDGLLYYHLDTRKFTPAVSNQSRAIHQLYGLYRDHDGTVWVGTRSQGLYCWERDRSVLVPYADRENNRVLSQSFVLAIEEYPKGIIWAGTNKGLLRIDKKTNRLKQYNLQSKTPLTNEEILCITPHEKYLWLGSHGGGLMRLDPETDSIRYFNTSDGLSSNIIYGIIQDGGYLWLSTENGISRFDPAAMHFRNYYAKDGLNNNEFNTASHLKARDGQIYFGGVDGINSFYPGRLTDKIFTGTLVLTSLRRDNTELMKGADLAAKDYPVTLPYDERNLSIQFALTDFYQPRGNSFYYRIKGLDEDWVSLGSQNFLRISQMPAGDYELQIKAKNINDQQSVNTLALRLHVEQPFYKRAWFIVMMIILSLLILYIFYSMRVHQLVTMQALRTKIASDLHDEVGSMLTRISILTEVLKFKNKDQDEISQIAIVSRQATATMSDVLWSVDARNDKIGNLVDRLREHADSLLLPLSITIRFESRLDEGKPMKMQLRQNVLLIFKEAIHNIAKHSGATEVFIQLTTNQGAFSMSIRDNGKHGDAKAGTGQGLKNMEMRAREAGGNIRFEKEDGFTVVFTT